MEQASRNVQQPCDRQKHSTITTLKAKVDEVIKHTSETGRLLALANTKILIGRVWNSLDFQTRPIEGLPHLYAPRP